MIHAPRWTVPFYSRLTAHSAVCVLLALCCSLAMAAKPKETPGDASANPGLAERQLERKKQEWRDVKAEQRRVLEEFLRCVDAAKSLPDMSGCERAEREESTKIKRAMRGLEAKK